MKRRIVSCALVFSLALSLFILSSCGNEKKADGVKSIAVSYYAPALAGSTELPVGINVYTVDAYEGIDLINRTLKLLLTDPPPEWIEPPYPEGMTLSAANISDKNVTVNLSQEYLTSNASTMAIADYCIVTTLCGLSCVDGVRFLVGGRPHPVYGVKYLNESNFIVSETAFTPEPTRILVYFPMSDQPGLIRQTRYVRIQGGESSERYIMEELMKGPSSEGFLPAVPKDTELLSVYTENGVCYVNFSEEFSINQQLDKAGAKYSVYAIVNSLTELARVDSVRFLISGETVRYYNGIDMSEPLERNVDYISGPNK